MSVKDLSLDDTASRLAVAEKELDKSRKVAKREREEDSKMFKLETTNKELASQCMGHKRAAC